VAFVSTGPALIARCILQEEEEDKSVVKIATPAAGALGQHLLFRRKFHLKLDASCTLGIFNDNNYYRGRDAKAKSAIPAMENLRAGPRKNIYCARPTRE
jgi:hypothetical protein